MVKDENAPGLHGLLLAGEGGNRPKQYDRVCRHLKSKHGGDERDGIPEREREEKGKQNKYHDDRAKTLTFSVGDFVLVFWPTKRDKLSNQWQNPFPIAKVITQ